MLIQTTHLLVQTGEEFVETKTKKVSCGPQILHTWEIALSSICFYKFQMVWCLGLGLGLGLGFGLSLGFGLVLGLGLVCLAIKLVKSFCIPSSHSFIFIHITSIT